MIRDALVLSKRELTKWSNSKPMLFMSFFMPLVWLALFGQAFRLDTMGAGGILGGAPNYFSYMAVGMLCIMALTTSMQSGISLVQDRRSGFLEKLRVAPIPRESIPTAHVLTGTVKAVLLSLVTFVIAIVFQFIPGMEGLILGDSFDIAGFGVLVLVLFLVALTFGSLFTMVAIRIESQEVLMMVINLLNLPLMFASAALFPVDTMPDWLAAVARVNPLTLASDALRQVCFGSSNAIYALSTDIAGLAVFAVIMLAIGMFVSRKALGRE